MINLLAYLVEAVLSVLEPHQELVQENFALRQQIMVEQDRNWSGRVTRESNALDLEEGVFTWRDPHRIALSLKHSSPG